ncbi:hypothetical protein [Streptomyces sp. NPDC012888]|uniref:hypothetical protein n=1 Tax=Streptomyces sp. NPDC012888 TaxID=3364855 RepID=UPI0036C445FF
MRGPARWPLTTHQATVLAAVAEAGDAPLAEIAYRLDRPRSWVAARLSEAYKRLDVAWMDRDERRAAAVRIARRRGLIPTEPPEAA